MDIEKIARDLNEVEDQLDQARDAFAQSPTLGGQNDYAIECIIRAIGRLSSTVAVLAHEIKEEV